MTTYEVRYWQEDGKRFASWLTTTDHAEAERVASDLQKRRRRNRIEVAEEDADEFERGNAVYAASFAA